MKNEFHAKFKDKNNNLTKKNVKQLYLKENKEIIFLIYHVL